jgi:hypothetical protein
MAYTSEEGAFATVSQDRWEKTQEILSRLWNELENLGGRYKHADLLSSRGYLIYVAKTYSTMCPYLKGLNLTVDGWRPGQDEEGWKDMEWYDDYPSMGSNEDIKDAPEFVSGVPRLRWDLEALRSLFSGLTPAVRTLRPSH